MLSDLLKHGHDLRVLKHAKSQTPLHCMASSAGYEQRRNEVYSWDGLKRGASPFLVIQHTLDGEGRLNFTGAQYRLTPGQTMVVTIPHAHHYWLERGGYWDYFWMALHGREALRLARELIDTHGPVLHLPTAVIDRLAASCLTLIDQTGLAPGEASAFAYSAMMALHDGMLSADTVNESALPPAIARTIAYITANLAHPLQIDQLTTIAEMSRGHFVRQFTATTGSAPSHYVLDRRLDRIERLLLATDMRVSTIARMTGFANANYLAKAFRSKRGMTPLQYRLAGRLAAGA